VILPVTLPLHALGDRDGRTDPATFQATVAVWVSGMPHPCVLPLQMPVGDWVEGDDDRANRGRHVVGVDARGVGGIGEGAVVDQVDGDRVVVRASA
jgi:hypothetical protein